MTQYLFNTGTTLNVTAIPEFANLNTQQLPMEEIRILVDTTIARTIILPHSSMFPVRNVKITVVDISGLAAVNNITVQASLGAPNDTINGSATDTLNQGYQVGRYEILDSYKYYNSIPASSGGSGVVDVEAFSPAVPNQTVFILPQPVNIASAPTLLVNGQGQEYGTDYSIAAGVLLSWLSDSFSLAPSDRLNLYHN